MSDGDGSEGSGDEAGTEPAAATDRGATDDSEPTPTAVFELLADETRLDIVRELAAARQSNWQWSGASFAELRRAVGVTDAGNFSYHLEKLRGPLVVKDGDEYHLRNRGMELVGAVESGQYAGAGTPLRGETRYDCPYPDCDRNLVGVYENQYFRVRCPDHHVFTGTALPPVVAEHNSIAALVSVALLDMRQQLQRARAGVCPSCWGPIEGQLPGRDASVPGLDDVELPDDALLATFHCAQCGLSFDIPPGACVVEHPAVVAFYHDHGENVRDRPYVDLPFCHVGRGDLESTAPVRVRIAVELGADLLTLWLDSDTTVVEYERG